MLSTYLKPLASLRLTVILLAAAMVLIFAGTWAQIDHDIWTVQQTYFHSFFCWIPFQLFFPRPHEGEMGVPGRIPMLGGYTLCALLLVNLLAAHTLRFKFSIKRTGIILIHLGVILLIGGELVSSVVSDEGQMPIEQGGSSNWTHDIRKAELAVIDTSPVDHDQVTVVSAGMLRPGATLSDSRLPFDIHVDEYWRNSTLAGEARNPHFVPAAPGNGLSSSADYPFAQVTLSKAGEALGTFQLTTMPLRWYMPIAAHLSAPKAIATDGKKYLLALRFKRTYKPYTIQLLKFSHDKYTGSETPKNFASRVHLIDSGRGEDRQTLIWMNHPLRYAGETFYQSGFLPADQGTILQVVKNPGWLIPYVACGLGALGLLIHFGMHLVGFLQRNAAGKRIRDSGFRIQDMLIPGAAAAICVVYLMSLFVPASSSGSFDLQAFGHLPISYEGRTMPLDSLGRNALRIISGRDTFVTDGRSQPAIQWLIDVISNKEQARDYRVFRIDHPDIVGLMNLDSSRTRFSFMDVSPALAKLAEQATAAQNVDEHNRALYQRKVLELEEHLSLVDRISRLGPLYLAPPLSSGGDWRTIDDAVEESKKTGAINPGVRQFVSLLEAYSNNRPEEFNSTVASYQSFLKQKLPAATAKADFEHLFNQVAPFYQAMILYVVIFLLVCVSWLGFRQPLARSAYWLLVVVFLLHSFGLAARIYISGRPPITNLYSTAIFIPWAAVAFCIVLEKLYRNGIATAVASLVAFVSLIIAHHLAGDGDTMRMLQAVLDTNLWLATHVVVINLGYSATYLAGCLAIAYIILGLFTRALAPTGNSESLGKALTRMVYGIACFAILFSFVGTILGGLWADQSWGRFWGWDPKENGAILLVLWNAIILHARFGGLVRERGLMLLAIFGNVVTTWSYFGTNMLGVGLHSYGFIDSAVFWISIFISTQLLLIGLGNIPLHWWRSFATERAPKGQLAMVGAE